MADIIEQIRVAVRRRVAGKLIEESAYQRQWMDDAPAADVYLRETVMEETREQISQSGVKVTALVELDIFVRRGAFPNPMAVASDYAQRIYAEFDPLDESKVTLALGDGTVGYIQAPPRQEAPAQEEELYYLPVLFSVGVYL